MNKKNNQKGFTLIEMLLVVLLLALTVGLTIDMLLSLIRSNTKTQVINEIEQQANFVTLKLEKELRDALDAIGTHKPDEFKDKKDCPEGKGKKFFKGTKPDQIAAQINGAAAAPAYDPIILDLNGDGIVNDKDRTNIGNPTPDFAYGINIGLKYKGFDLGIDIGGVYGNEIYRVWGTAEQKNSVYNYLKINML